MLKNKHFNISFIKVAIIGTLILAILITYINKHKQYQTNESEISLSSLLQKTKSELKTGHKIQIEVQNGCGFPRVANLYTNFLRNYGYDVIDLKNASHFNYEKTLLIVHTQDTSNFIDEIVDLLKIEPRLIQFHNDNNIFYEMTLIIGNDYNTLESFDDVSMHYQPF